MFRALSNCSCKGQFTRAPWGSHLFLLIYVLLASSISLYFVQSTWQVELLIAITFVTVALAWIKPHWILGLFFIAVIIITDSVTEELENAEGIFFISDIKIAVGIPPLIVMTLLLLCVIYLLKFKNDKRISIVPFGYFYIYLCVLIVATINSVYSGIPLGDNLKAELLRFIYPVLCFYLSVNILNKTNVIPLIWVVFIACFVRTLLLDFYFLSGHGWPYDGYQIVTQDSAALMVAGIMASLALLLLFIQGYRKGIFFIVLAAVPMVFALLFSLRRSHWVGQVASIAFMYFWSPRIIRKKLILGISAFSALLLVGFISFDTYNTPTYSLSTISDRLLTIFDPQQHSNRHHFLETIQTVKDILHKPVLGLGLGSEHTPVSQSLIEWPEDSQPTNVVHNSFVYVWMKLGLPGVIIFFGAGFKLLGILRTYRKRCIYRGSWPYVTAIGSGLGIWLVMFLTGPVPWFLHQTFLIAFFSAALVNLTIDDEIPVSANEFILPQRDNVS